MAREGLAWYRACEERTGRAIGFRETGMAFLCSALDRRALEANVALQRSLGVEVEILDGSAWRDVEPRGRFPDDLIGALEHEAGFVDPALTLAAVGAECRQRGVEIREGVAVTDVLRESDQVRGVRTSDGATIESRTIVNAGGPWAGRLCARIGVNLPLTVVRPEQAFFAPPPERGGERLVYGDLLTGLYWKPERTGWTRVGNMSYADDQVVDDPEHFDEGVSARFIDTCRARLAERLPDYERAVSWGGCGALYTITPDAHALIGELPGLRGFYIVSGFSGHGFKMGPAVGRGVAAIIDGRRGDEALDPAFFAVDRFERGHAVKTAYEYGILG
jgi:glycine/D-amino acid oxidase-like deaminating enzyme